MARKPIIKNLLWAELNYIDCGEDEPVIEDDRVLLTSIVRLEGRHNPKNFKMRLSWTEEDGTLGELFIDPSEASEEINPENKKDSFLHFLTPELLCKKNYQCDLVYKGKPLSILKTKKGRYSPLTIETPPARQDPQPIIIAVGGDQERYEQLGPLGRLFGLNNYSHTKQIYKHIGTSKDKSDLGAYQLFIHLGDLFNGEVYFSLSNLFQHNRHVFERRVETEEAFDYHLDSDFFKPVKRYLAEVSYGVYTGTDDHDFGINGKKKAVTEEEKAVEQNMENSFHKGVGLPRFSTQVSDGYGTVRTENGRAGPYFKKRIGQSEFYILHNRLTRTENAKPDSFLLSEEQWEWLEASLAESKASNKVIVSPLPFVMGKNPGEDYRAHWQEWHRFMQLCRKYKVGTILTADSHNYSESELHVANADDPDDNTTWVVHHHLIGTLGGSSQHITEDELANINRPGRPPLLPQDEEFPRELYEGSRVISYFSPGSKKALLPQQEQAEIHSLDGQENKSATESQWTEKNQWQKHTHGYARFAFTPQTTTLSHELEINGADGNILPDKIDSDLSPGQVDGWQVNMSFFACNRKHSIAEETRLTSEYRNPVY